MSVTLANGLIDNYFTSIKEVLNQVSRESISNLYQALLDAYRQEKQVFVMGNGGSASTASHFTCDINKGVCINLKKRFRVVCLNDNMPTLLAYGNDFSFEDIFVEPLKNFLEPGDLVIGFSGSGNSKNLLKAFAFAKERDAKTFGITGFDGGRLSQLSHDSIVVPIRDMQKSEDVHLMMCHLMMQMLCLELDPTALTCYQRNTQKSSKGDLLNEN